MKYFITGSAGFIASNLTDKLLKSGNHVIGYDNLSTGNSSFLQSASSHPRFNLIIGDILDFDKLKNNGKPNANIISKIKNINCFIYIYNIYLYIIKLLIYHLLVYFIFYIL